MTYLRTLIGTRIRDRAKIPAAQAYDRLPEFLATAAKHVPFYHSKIPRVGMPFTEIAPTRKSDIQADLLNTLNRHQLDQMGITIGQVDRFIAQHLDTGLSWLDRKILVSRTSGTSGETGLIFNSRRTWSRQRALSNARLGHDVLPLAKIGLLRKTRIAYIIEEGPGAATGQGARENDAISLARIETRIFSIYEDSVKVMESVAKFRPHILISYPTTLEILAFDKMKHDPQGHSPELIVSGSDVLSSNQRSQILHAFPESKLRDQYGATECFPIASSCAFGHKHVSTDYVILEPVDAEDRPTPEGEFSHHVLVTGLLNDFQPFIRYRLDDSIRIDHRPCPCGSLFPIVDIRGRRDQNLAITRNNGDLGLISAWLLHEAVHEVKDVDGCLIRYHVRDHIEIYIYHPLHALEDVLGFEQKTKFHLRNSLKRLLREFHCDEQVQVKIEYQNRPPSRKGEGFKRRNFDIKVQVP